MRDSCVFVSVSTCSRNLPRPVSVSFDGLKVLGGRWTGIRRVKWLVGSNLSTAHAALLVRVPLTLADQ